MKKSPQTTKKADNRWHSAVATKGEPRITLVSTTRMSASGLTLAQLKTLKYKLVEIREELLRSIQLKTQHVLHHAFELENTLQGDDAEVAEKQRLSNSNLQEMEFLKSRLSLVDRALLKMKENCYGICEECEESIGFERCKLCRGQDFRLRCKRNEKFAAASLVVYSEPNNHSVSLQVHSL